MSRLTDERGAPATIVVDVANVVGSRPDGWWRDRAGAASRLIAELAGLIGAAVRTGDGTPITVGSIVAVVEGAARAATGTDPVETVRAERDGDSEVVAQAEKLAELGRPPIVVTADRGLRARLPDAATPAPPRWLLHLLGR